MYFAFCDVRYTVYWTSVDFCWEHHICTVNLTYILYKTLFTIPLGCCLIWFDNLWNMWSVFKTRMYRRCDVDSLVCISWPAGSSLQMLCRKSWWLHVDSMAGHTLAATLWVFKYYSSTCVCWLNCRSLYIYTHTHIKLPLLSGRRHRETENPIVLSFNLSTGWRWMVIVMH